MSVEERVERLENLVNALVKKIDNDKFFNDADKKGLRQAEGENSDGVTKNSADIDFIAMETGVDLEG